jgi:hypothetical protein
MKKIIYFLVASSFLFFLFQPKISLADVFVVNLNYDQSSQTLSLDKAGVTVDKNQTVPLSDIYTPSTAGSYKMVLLEDQGIQAFSWQFNPKSGSFNINLPYTGIAKKLEIMDSSSGKILLQADLSKLSTCNTNGICEFNKGEDIYTCLVDCASSNVKYDQQTLELLQENNGVIKDQKTGEILLQTTIASSSPAKNNNLLDTLLIIGAIAVVGGVIFLIIKNRK